MEACVWVYSLGGGVWLEMKISHHGTKSIIDLVFSPEIEYFATVMWFHLLVSEIEPSGIDFHAPLFAI